MNDNSATVCRREVAPRRSMMIPGALAVAAALALGGCDSPLVELVVGGKSMSDLNAYVTQVLSRKSRKVEELPPVEPYISYAYQSGEATDPFEPFFKEEPPVKTTAEGSSSGLQPPANHIAQELEQFPLDSLRMMGTLQNAEELWGIVRSPDGNIHRVKPGDYMGKNYGKITAINEADIELLEIIPDGQGGWTERPAQLALVEE